MVLWGSSPKGKEETCSCPSVHLLDSPEGGKNMPYGSTRGAVWRGEILCYLEWLVWHCKMTRHHIVKLWQVLQTVQLFIQRLQDLSISHFFTNSHGCLMPDNFFWGGEAQKPIYSKECQYHFSAFACLWCTQHGKSTRTSPQKYAVKFKHEK